MKRPKNLRFLSNEIPVQIFFIASILKPLLDYEYIINYNDPILLPNIQA